MRKKLVLIGAGAHSDAIVPLINFSEYELVGFIDDKDITNRIGYPIIGKISDINNLAEKYIFDSLLFSIGDNDKRIEVYNEIKIKDKLINIISPDAKIITPTSIIGADAPVFDNSIINTNAVVEHHSIIREHCNVGPSATINENVVLNEGVYVGSGAIIIQYITVVKNVILGVGAVVAMKLVHMLVCLLKESSKEVYE